MIDLQTAQQMVTGLPAFRGRDLDDYSFLVEPLSELVVSGYRSLGALNKFAEDMLSATPENTPTEIEPNVSAQLLADHIKPWIEDIRQRLFHSKTAPFSSIEDAEKWCDETEGKLDEWSKRADEWIKRRDEWIKRADERDAFWDAMCEKYPYLDDSEIRRARTALRKQGISVEKPTKEEFQRFDDLSCYVDSLVVGDVPEKDAQVKVYLPLLEEVLKINKGTGFATKSVRMYILADASPVLPPFTFGIHTETQPLPDGTSLVNRSARVRIRGELTFEDLRSLYRSIRRELGIKRSKHPTTTHLQLYKMVRRKGTIPRGKGTVAFWKSVMKEWNDLNPQKKYKTWKGVKLAYERIIAQIERRITA